MFEVDATEVVMATTNNERGKIQGVTQQRGTALADLAAPLDRVARVVQTRVEAHVGDILFGGVKVVDGVRFGMDRRDQRAGEAEGIQGRVEFLGALVQLLL